MPFRVPHDYQKLTLHPNIDPSLGAARIWVEWLRGELAVALAYIASVEAKPAPVDPAVALTDALFTNGGGSVGDRIAIKAAPEKEGGRERDLGGYCRETVLQTIRQFFPEAQPK